MCLLAVYSSVWPGEFVLILPDESILKQSLVVLLQAVLMDTVHLWKETWKWKSRASAEMVSLYT